MLRLRSPESLGISIPILSSIPIVGGLINNAGALLSGDICGAIPLNVIPGLKDMVAKVGCNQVGRDALAVYLNQYGGPAVAAVGTATAVSCLCSGQLGPGANIPPPAAAPSPLSNPLVLAGIAAAVIGLVVFMSKKSTPREAPRNTTTTATTTYTPTSSTVGIL